ncbi:NirD/YgiW/YdeI family stress tolerance protein [Pseudoxanthomonas sp. UTMC 1351]|uniref:NirD/YgiW/YdeI family stress tolerance protein n=1 Tax=Pseudoxanthomonas sp. UTMC 1351 TaxID=2695853 RepID=UPI0034CE7C1A
MKFQMLITCTLCCVPALAPAQYLGPGATPEVTTVFAANSAADDTPATLEGKLVRKISHDDYEFKDDTGSMRVEIDDDVLSLGRSIDASTKLRLIGEVDKGMIAVEIDVKRVEIVE